MPYKSRARARKYWRRYSRERRRKAREAREQEAQEHLEQDQVQVEAEPVQDPTQEETAGREVDPTARDAIPHKLDKLLDQVDSPEKAKGRPISFDNGKPDPWGWMR
jgi:hypothetical protein